MNSTTTATSIFGTTSWITAFTVSLICWFILVWIFACLICYGVRNKKWSIGNGDSDDRDSLILYTLAVVATSFSIIHTTINIVTYNFGHDEASLQTCVVGVLLSVEFFAFTMSWTYLFLWFRQRAIYKHNLFIHLYTPLVRVISWLSIFLMLLGINSAIIIYNVCSKFSSTGAGCVNKGAHWPAIYGTAVNGTGQIAMFLLFLYPVVNIPTVRSTCRIIRILKRTTICTAFCIGSDLVAGIYVGVSKESDKIGLSFYNFNLVLNIIAMVITFAMWWRIILSPFNFASENEAPSPA
uniref:Uncharacterized protein LOC100184227 n=1 Tax=Phallusia mammillata TaxID=59560 RepID=A0A6F9DIP2_9ASCI|nr:uncharacterized protein LOC100184227 [Phallusia mammillata]